jgi:glycine dehydrogenase subunit 2
MGGDGIREAAELSVLANNYMERRLLEIRGVTKSHPHLDGPRMEMTRYSVATLTEETGVTVGDISNRMLDFGIDAPWLSHHPLLVPEPITPEAGELWSVEDIDYWIDVLGHVCHEAYTTPEIVRTAPHNQAVGKVDLAHVDDPAHRATTWRAHLRNLAARREVGAEQMVGALEGGANR